MNKNWRNAVNCWSGWWWVHGNLLHCPLYLCLIFEHFHNTKFFKNHYEYIVPVMNKSFISSVKIIKLSCSGYYMTNMLFLAHYTLFLTAYLFNRCYWSRFDIWGNWDSKNLAKDSRQVRWGRENSHTMEVSNVHIVRSLYKYYCTWACLFHCHLQYFSASCFYRKMNQPLSVYPR